MNTVQRTLINLMIEDLPFDVELSVFQKLRNLMDPERYRELLVRAEEMVRIKEQTTQRMDHYRAESFAELYGKQNPAWEGDVDRQGGSFTQDEINNPGWK